MLLSFDDLSGIGGSFSTIREEYEYLKSRYPTFIFARKPKRQFAADENLFTFSSPPVPTNHLRLLASLSVFFLKLVKHTSLVRPSVFHAHDPYVASVAAIVARLMHIRLVLNVHGPLAYEFQYFNITRRNEFGFRDLLLLAIVASLERFAYRAADVVIAISDFERGFVDQVRTRNVFVIRNGINMERFHPCTDKNELRRVIGLPMGSRIVTYVGRIVPKNGVLTIAEAISYVLKRRKDVAFVFVGDGFAESDCKRIVADAGYSQYVRFVGRKSNPAPFYQASDLFVSHVSTLVKGVGLTTLEAIACGVPVIVGFDKLTHNRLGELAFYAPKDDPTSLGQKILTVLNEGNLNQVSKQLRKFAETSLSWDSTFRAYEKLLFQSGET